MAMSAVTFAGASQFAAIGYLAQHLPWPEIIALTALLNARHLLYSASLAPSLREQSRLKKALMAHFLTDESFALTATYFKKRGAVDISGFWIAGVFGVFIPWNVGTLIGALVRGAVVNPTTIGLDVAFPATMAALTVGLITERRELVAASVGVVVGVLGALFVAPAFGIVAAGVLGPLVALRVGGTTAHRDPDSEVTGRPVSIEQALRDSAEDAHGGEQ
jgi:4-azaleucine resistance transporter AzlC